MSDKAVAYIDAEDLAKIYHEEDVQVIDVRNGDFYGGHIPNATNVPYGEEWTDSTFLDQLIEKVAEKKKVVFHCMKSQQRGPFCAKEFAARLEEINLDHKPEVLILKNGYENWESTQSDKIEK